MPLGAQPAPGGRTPANSCRALGPGVPLQPQKNNPSRAREQRESPSAPPHSPMRSPLLLGHLLKRIRPSHQRCANLEPTDAIGGAGVPPNRRPLLGSRRRHALCHGARRRRPRIILLHDSGDEPNEKEAEARILVVELEDLVLGDRIKAAVDFTDRAHGAHALPRE
jgi:hypothetical protein